MLTAGRNLMNLDGREVGPNPEYEWQQNGIEWRQDAIALTELEHHLNSNPL